MPKTKHYQITFQVEYRATVDGDDAVTPEQAMRMIPLATEDVQETDDLFYHLTLDAGSYRLVHAEEGQDVRVAAAGDASSVLGAAPSHSATDSHWAGGLVVTNLVTGLRRLVNTNLAQSDAAPLASWRMAQCSLPH